ncbi:hypothetical protein [Hymenobacter metallicola]|uniref:DUF4142 domain-containing protein n=1 Tax=Hymenobacter metallicola TaxID=2563114 RepID=A0A4Z0QDG3_9BACT|nr:hypothetical protein [Hymenobacter metallicola]TGE27526.1 hypothetical protein E5K02_14220 [Hymenobacter metallicola]
MKKTLLTLSILVGLTHAATATVLQPDTLAGQGKLVRNLSATLCARLEEENKKKPLNTLTPEEGKSLITSSLFASMSQHADQFTAFLEQATKNNGDSQAIGRAVGTDVILLLGRECQIAQGLIMRMGMNAYQGKPTISAKEQPLLQKMTVSVCEYMDKENQKAPLASRTPQERTDIMTQAMQSTFTIHEKAVKTIYGNQVLEKQADLELIGRKIALLMAEQCPGYLMQVSLDEVEKKKQN